jgi:hypothetical protein
VDAKPATSRTPLGPALYAAWSVISSLLVAAGAHREAYHVLRGLSLQSLVVAAATGLANLSWYEVAYVVGGGLKRVAVFDVIPILGVGAGLLGGASILARPPWNRLVPLAHVALGLLLGGLSLLVLAWRHVRGFEDPWRLVATLGFLAGYAAWGVMFAARSRGTPRTSLSRGR